MKGELHEMMSPEIRLMYITAILIVRVGVSDISGHALILFWFLIHVICLAFDFSDIPNKLLAIDG